MPSLPKSPVEHLAFLKGLAALKVRFALDWSASHPKVSFARALADLTNFSGLGAWNRASPFDRLDMDDGSRVAWAAFLARASELTADPGAEAAILALLPPDDEYFVPRVGADLAALHDPERGLAAFPSNLWTGEHPAALEFPEDPRAPRILEFHMANRCYPDSFLKHPEVVRSDIRGLALKARDLGFPAIGTRSWLNDHPAWVGCFPPAWADRRTPADHEDVGGHLGVWGQVITARQTLSHHADRFVRNHGRFEFAMRASWMSVDEALGWTQG